MKFGCNQRCRRRGDSKLIISIRQSIHLFIHYSYPLLKRFYLGSNYVVFGIGTAFNLSALLLNEPLLSTKDHLYVKSQVDYLQPLEFYLSFWRDSLLCTKLQLLYKKNGKIASNLAWHWNNAE